MAYYATVYKHNGREGTLLVICDTEQIARFEFKDIAKGVTDRGEQFELVGNIEKFETRESHDKWLSAFRKSKGKTPLPSAEESVENAKRVLSDPQSEEADEADE